MSVEELQRVVDEASPTERLYLKAYLRIAELREQPEHSARLADRVNDPATVGLDDLESLHRTLADRGL